MKRGDIFVQLLSLFPAGRLVDLGTGHGGFAKLAKDRGWQVTAVDARDERWPADNRIEWVKCDIREFDLSGYDLICCLGLFYHLTCQDQLDFLRRASGTPLIIDTHVDAGAHKHKLGRRQISEEGFEGRWREEPNKTTSSWGNRHAFWPTPAAFYKMLEANGYPVVLTTHPWHESDRTFFVALPE